MSYSRAQFFYSVNVPTTRQIRATRWFPHARSLLQVSHLLLLYRPTTRSARNRDTRYRPSYSKRHNHCSAKSRARLLETMHVFRSVHPIHPHADSLAFSNGGLRRQAWKTQALCSHLQKRSVMHGFEIRLPFKRDEERLGMHHIYNIKIGKHK